MINEVARSLHIHICRMNDNVHSQLGFNSPTNTYLHIVDTFSSNVGRLLWRTSILGGQTVMIMMSWFVTVTTSTHKICIISCNTPKEAQQVLHEISWYCIVLSSGGATGTSLATTLLRMCLYGFELHKSFQGTWNHRKYFGNKLASQNSRHTSLDYI